VNRRQALAPLALALLAAPREARSEPGASPLGLYSSALELRIAASPYRFEVRERSTGRVLVRHGGTGCRTGSRILNGTDWAANAVGVARDGGELTAALAPASRRAPRLAVRFRFPEPEILRVDLRVDGTTANATHSNVSITERFEDAGESIYGLFEAAWPRLLPGGADSRERGLDDRGVEADLLGNGMHAWLDGMRYSSARAPFHMTSAGYGIYVRSPWKGHYRLAIDGETSFEFDDAALTYFVIYGPSYDRILARYNALAGPSRMPPDWALGPTTTPGAISGGSRAGPPATGSRSTWRTWGCAPTSRSTAAARAASPETARASNPGRATRTTRPADSCACRCRARHESRSGRRAMAIASVYFDRFHWGRKLRARSRRRRARRPRFGYHRGAMNLPRTADVVIIGGGVVGCSIAYHLARRGARDVLVLERETVGAGTTSKAAGGIRAQFPTETEIRFSLEAIRVFERFQDEFGVDPGYRKIGYLFLISDADDLRGYESRVALQRSLGVDVRIVTPREARALVPALHVDDLIAAVWGPEDGMAGPAEVTNGFARRARELGARIAEGVDVAGIELEGGRVKAVVTASGVVGTRLIVNAAGPAAARVGRLAGVDLPVLPRRRHIFFTEPFPELPGPVPLTTDRRSGFYFRKEMEQVLLSPGDVEDVGDDPDVAVDRARIAETVEKAIHRVPLLEKARIAGGWAGLRPLTPDDHAIIGWAPGVEGFFVAVGFGGHGFQHSPTTGRVVSEWLTDGAPPMDLSLFAPDRFARGTSAAHDTGPDAE